MPSLACSNSRKIRCCASGAMPMPVSRTRKEISLGQMPGSTISATPPVEVNFIALPARLSSTWRIRPRRQQFGDIFDQCGQRERAMLEVDLAGLDLGIVQELLDQRQQRVSR